jgi:hypothetical protein
MIWVLGTFLIFLIQVDVTSVNATTVTNNTSEMIFDSVNFTKAANALTEAFGEPFYVLQDTNDTGSELLNTNPLQTKDSYSGEGMINGVGNVTEIGTYTTTYGLGTTKSVGKGVIGTGDGHVVTFTGEDRGQTDYNGTVLYRGIMFFEVDPRDSKLGFLSNKMGMYLYAESPGGYDATKVWLIK